MPVFERHERGACDRFLHARDMACGQEVPTAQAAAIVGWPKDRSCCISRSSEANAIQTRSARLPPLLRHQARRSPLWTAGAEGTSGLRVAWGARHPGQAGAVSAVGAIRGVQGRHSRRTFAACAIGSHAPAALPAGQPADKNEADNGLADARLACAGAANAASQYLGLSLKHKAAQVKITRSGDSRAAAALRKLFAWRLSSLARQEAQSVIRSRSSFQPSSRRVARQ